MQHIIIKIIIIIQTSLRCWLTPAIGCSYKATPMCVNKVKAKHPGPRQLIFKEKRAALGGIGTKDSLQCLCEHSTTWLMTPIQRKPHKQLYYTTVLSHSACRSRPTNNTTTYTEHWLDTIPEWNIGSSSHMNNKQWMNRSIFHLLVPTDSIHHFMAMV